MLDSFTLTRLIRVEGGGSSITKVDLDALLTKYSVTSESHRDRLQALNRGAKEPGWWDGCCSALGTGSWSSLTGLAWWSAHQALTVT